MPNNFVGYWSENSSIFVRNLFFLEENIYIQVLTLKFLTTIIVGYFFIAKDFSLSINKCHLISVVVHFYKTNLLLPNLIKGVSL